jgi:predicted PurR-regulated permease PerM
VSALWSRWLDADSGPAPGAEQDPAARLDLALPIRGRRVPRTGDIVRVTLVVLAIAAFAALLWRLADVVLLVFVAVVMATALRGFGELVAKLFGMPVVAGVAIAGIVAVAVAGAFGFFLGQEIAAQVTAIWTELPRELDQIGQRIGIDDLGQQVVARFQAFGSGPSLIDSILGLTMGLVGWAANLLLALVAAFYLAFRPAAYQAGFLQLIPPSSRRHIGAALDASGRALKHWLIGQIVAMLLVGVLTTAGLLLLGVDSALALGVIAGVLEFVPYVGPWLSAVPAVLTALGDDGSLVYWVIGLYVLVQQVEGNIITPLIQRRAVSLPPVLTIFSLVAMGALFGPVGVLLATPITAVALVFVTQFYLRDTLHQNALMPGERPPRR